MKPPPPPPQEHLPKWRRTFEGLRHSENLREHYALTLAAWSANLLAHWDEAVADAGPATAKIWGLYLAACRVGFERNNTQLHQFLAVKLDAGADAYFPLRPTWLS